MEGRTKAELARRLRIEEADLLSREEVAAILSLDVGTLRTKASQHVGYFRLSDAKTSPALYPKPWVIKYKQWRDSGRKQSFELWAQQTGSAINARLGPQMDWPQPPDPEEVEYNILILLLARWKHKELFKRCERIIRQYEARDEILSQHYDCPLYDKFNRIRPHDDPFVVDILIQKAQEILHPIAITGDTSMLIFEMHMQWESLLETELGFINLMR